MLSFQFAFADTFVGCTEWPLTVLLVLLHRHSLAFSMSDQQDGMIYSGRVLQLECKLE
jgi:hypothetical protein